MDYIPTNLQSIGQEEKKSDELSSDESMCSQNDRLMFALKNSGIKSINERNRFSTNESMVVQSYKDVLLSVNKKTINENTTKSFPYSSSEVMKKNTVEMK